MNVEERPGYRHGYRPALRLERVDTKQVFEYDALPEVKESDFDLQVRQAYIGLYLK